MAAKSDYHAQQIPVDDVFVIGNRRGVNDEAVSALVESIGAIGLQTPITVRIQDDVPDPETGEVLASAYAIVAGRHRHEACRRLGWKYIPAIVREDYSELDAELWEIDENLCRAELSPAERAACTARRKVLYEQQHPETKAGENQHTRVRKVCEGTKPVDRFTSDTAAKTGQSERAVQLAAERGSKIAPDVMAEITGSQWDKGVVLDMLKRLSHDEQRQALQRVKSGISPSFHEAIEFIRGEDIRPARPAKVVEIPDQKDWAEVEEEQYAQLMRLWNKCSPAVKSRFFDNVPAPSVMDRRYG